MRYSVNNNGVVLSMVGASDSGFGIVSGPKPPPCFDCGGYAIVDGLFEVVDADLVLGANKDRLLSDLDTIANGYLGQGIVVNGLPVSTSLTAQARLNMAKANPRAQRKIVTNGGRFTSLVTETEFNSLVSEVEKYGQGVIDNWHDLIELINSETDLNSLLAVDLNSGWPSNIITA